MMYVTQGLHRLAQQTPDTPATICGHRETTWAESADRIARLAAGLIALGVGSGDRVAILSLNSDRYHEYLFAVPWADAVVVPVNIRWSAPEVAYSLNDSESTVLFVDDAFAPMVTTLRESCPTLRHIVHCGDNETPDGMAPYDRLLTSEPVDDARRGGSELAGIFYTGGTTGFPKGVMLSHDNLLVSALGTCATGNFLAPGGRFLHSAPMFHLADLAGWIGQNLVGGTHVTIPMFSPDGVIDAIAAHHVTEALLVPTMIQMLVDHPRAADADLSSLRRVIYGASPISEGLLARVAEALPGVQLTQAYGMTELAPVATLLSPEDHDNPKLRRAAGRAAPHAEVRIVNTDGRDLARGTVGEVVVRGGHVMLGYWHKPEETTAALHDGWMHTGDGGYMDEDGYVYIVDRLKDMIVSGGENVYSVEVENALSSHPAVAACAVIGVPDDDWGERVHAVVVPQDGATVSLDELREHCKALIAGYKAPRSVEVVDALPMSGAGKVLKRELRQRFWEGTERAVQ